MLDRPKELNPEAGTAMDDDDPNATVDDEPKVNGADGPTLFSDVLPPKPAFDDGKAALPNPADGAGVPNVVGAGALPNAPVEGELANPELIGAAPKPALFDELPNDILLLVADPKPAEDAAPPNVDGAGVLPPNIPLAGELPNPKLAAGLLDPKPVLGAGVPNAGAPNPEEPKPDDSAGVPKGVVLDGAATLFIGCTLNPNDCVLDAPKEGCKLDALPNPVAAAGP